MALLNEAQLKQVSDAIEAVEKDTDAELVTVLAKQADNYFYIPTLWAAMLALLLPALLRMTHFWLSADELFMLQWIVFIVFARGWRRASNALFSVPGASSAREFETTGQRR